MENNKATDANDSILVEVAKYGRISEQLIGRNDKKPQ